MAGAAASDEKPALSLNGDKIRPYAEWIKDPLWLLPVAADLLLGHPPGECYRWPLARFIAEATALPKMMPGRWPRPFYITEDLSRKNGRWGIGLDAIAALDAGELRGFPVDDDLSMIGLKGQHWLVKPADFVRWAKGKFTIPEELRPLLDGEGSPGGQPAAAQPRAGQPAPFAPVAREWLKKDRWTLHEAVLLAHGFDPDSVAGPHQYPEAVGKDCALADLAIGTGELKVLESRYHEAPGDGGKSKDLDSRHEMDRTTFLNWARNNLSVYLHQVFIDFLLKPELFDAPEAGQGGEGERDAPENQGRVQLTPTELALLGALAGAGHKTLLMDEWAEKAGISEKLAREGRKELLRRGLVEQVTEQKDGGFGITAAGIALHKELRR